MKILTPVVNNPIFIEIQYKLFKKYIKGGDFEFIVFNDARTYPDYTNNGDLSLKNKIYETCINLGIKCINIDNNYQEGILDNQGSIRTGITMNIMLNYQKQNPDKYLIVDSDMFLIDYMDINKYDKYKCAFVLQIRQNNYRYMWNGLVYMDSNLIKDDINLLDWGMLNFTDTGGKTNEWLEKQILIDNIYVPTDLELRYNKEINYNKKSLYYIKHLWSLSWNETELPENLKDKTDLINFLINDTRNIDNKFHCEIYDNIFLHYRSGSNWTGLGLNFHNDNSLKLKKLLVD